MLKDFWITLFIYKLNKYLNKYIKLKVYKGLLKLLLACRVLRGFLENLWQVNFDWEIISYLLPLFLTLTVPDFEDDSKIHTSTNS